MIFQLGSQVEDDHNYEFFLEWLPLFAADLPWHSEMKAIQYRESNKSIMHDLYYAILVDTHFFFPSIRLSTHMVTLVARPCLQATLMEIHSAETPLCRPKMKSDLEDTMGWTCSSATYR